MRLVSTPISTNKLLPNPEEALKQEIYVYQRIVRLLLYITYIIRPDAARTLGKLLEFLRNPLPLHDAAAQQAITYLYQHRTLVIKYLGQNVGS